MTLYYSAWDFMRSGFFHGMGLGVCFVQIGAMAFNDIPDSERLETSIFFNISRNVGQSICASLGMSSLARNMQINQAEISQFINPFNSSLQLASDNILGSGNDIIDPSIYALLNIDVMRQAAMISYVNNFYAFAIITMVSLVLFFLLDRPPPQVAASP